MFKGKQKSATPKRKEVTFIAKEIEIQGDFRGNGAMQIEGVVDGNISVPSVVVGEHGTINGTIRATNVIVNGTLNGEIFCDNLEVMPNGQIFNTVNVNKLIIAGRIHGKIDAKEEIVIVPTAEVEAMSIKSQNIIVNGKCKGNVVASQLLEIGSTGSVEGEITVKNIKTHEGGKLLGSLTNYEEEKEEEKKESELFTQIAKRA
jgi:cytoskeletal protein CcmA (bactofilin family)